VDENAAINMQHLMQNYNEITFELWLLDANLVAYSTFVPYFLTEKGLN